ncbi:MAG: hypothetical protein J5671_06865 [Bacteroidaceae bacterium]|nr:hypothetical protein [Bacteroidaceae bacterium]
MAHFEIHDQMGMMDLIQQIGFLPLLDSGIAGFSAEEMADEDCRYVVFPDGGWDWPLWKWKGPIVTESPCVYGKFFAQKAGFVSRQWWPDLFNYRRSRMPRPEEGSIEDIILQTLREHESLITRQLRAECGFTGLKMRSRFDSFITRLQMGCYIITEDFVYPRDRHNREYGWGWSLLTTPEALLGREACLCDRTPQESYQRMFNHLSTLLPHATARQIQKLLA